MIAIKEIDAKNVNTYFNLQMTYLVEDEIITDQEEKIIFTLSTET